MTNKEICQKVTDKLLDLMKKGVNPWQKPWTGVNDNAISHTNGKAYSLINQILLNFRPGEYLTFQQVSKEGGKVRRGAKSQMIVFWKSGDFKKVVLPEDADTEEPTDEKGEWVKWKGPVLKYYNVFHIDDCEGIKKKFTDDDNKNLNPPTFTINTDAEKVAKSYCKREKVKLNISVSNRAFYAPLSDSVTVPERKQFSDSAEFYSTLYHELTHSTGHEKRLNRIKPGHVHFGDEDYSREELVAEIGAATSLAYLGIDSEKCQNNSAAYLKGWSKFIKNDPMAFVVAAGRAEKAVNMIFDIKSN